ncbi:MAG: thioredoxin domain-containing protein [Bacteriovoracaceae bacterium]|jgi:protein-disulfide isomerase/uncharacterized membrane protein|nr:thioredoxin domain-containing protein [Bacteriovoracaceae bacterium]
MNANKGLTLNGLSGKNLLLILVNIGMLITSIYLTKHFYQVNFPTGFGSADSLCSGTGFWSCNKATTSAFGSFFNIPTSFFGIVISVFVLIGGIFPSEKFERTNKFLSLINAIGCIILLAYSLIALSGLCQFCTLYYVLSFISFFLFYKFSGLNFGIEPKYLGVMFVVVLIPSIFLNSYYAGKEATKKNLSNQYIKQFEGLNTIGDPIIPSKYNLTNNDYSSAKIKLVVFSDFQCPFCQVVSDQMHELIQEFPNDISIQYMFYPLDASCNKNIKGRFHESACAAAYLAACDQSKFAQIHDFIFKHQKDLNSENLKKWEKDFGLNGCFNNENLKAIVKSNIDTGEQYKVKSTPTIIINGKKIEGTIPTIHLKSIIRSLL